MANKNAIRLFNLGLTPVLLGGTYSDLMEPQLIGWQTADYPAATFEWWPAKNNIGICCGYQHGGRNLIVFNFAREYRRIFPEWCELASQWLHQPLVVVSYGRGHHVYFYTEEAYPGCTLAGRYARGRFGRKWLTKFIETLGIGCCVVSVGGRHYNGRRHRFIGDTGYEDIPTLTARQYKNLIAISKSFDKRPKQPANKPLTRSGRQDGSILDDFRDCLDYARQAIGALEQVKWNGDIFFLKQGGLLITANGHGWYSFRDETGGGLPELIAWHQALVREGAC